VTADDPMRTAPPEVLDLELANLRAQFAELHAEWNDLFRKQRSAARRSRACGERIMELERLRTPDPIPDYNPDGGAR